MLPRAASHGIHCHRLTAQFSQNSIKDPGGDVYFVWFDNQRRAKTNRALAATQQQQTLVKTFDDHLITKLGIGLPVIPSELDSDHKP
jgi:hypothetical protein